ncbi:hypothetical protein [Glacieibacterium frigidum]|uniref:Uncharacterized protein n=1 Tax=Glacieibacterium frigidum TaxID=2593303 RepID=A0A552UHB7_9SPHN|nr:hypothetical protein [Glacieibacterium frigidum]TRW17577.1 hypothetical protein FMM06_05355 [Glacieibacterium frigidum]
MLLVALLLAAAAPAEPPPLMRTTTVFGDDPCPAATNGEIVVCGRLPEAERFRIPQKLRKPKNERTARPWSEQNAVLDDVARVQRPDSCSVVGSGGQTGCTAAMIRQWAAERRAGLGMPR